MDICPVSVIIPTYNRAHLIVNAIDSVLRETASGDEIIVVDDGSTDDTENVLSPYRDKLRYFKITNLGAGAARNFGIARARNPLIAFLDSDDEWMPGKLALQRTFMMARPDVLFSFTDFAVSFEKGGEARRYLKNWHRDPRPWDEILGPGEQYSEICPLPPGIEDFKFHVGNLYPAMFKNPYVCTITLIVRRENAEIALHFAEDLVWGEDWVCYGQLARQGPAAYLNCETAWQRGHGGERLTDTDMLDAVTTRIVIMERVWGSDEDFLRTHGNEYHNLLRSQRLLRTKELIASGRNAEARGELNNISLPPIWLRLLASLPGVLIKILFRFKMLMVSKLRARRV